MKLVRIGYWQVDQIADWPDPGEFIDQRWETTEREQVADYIRRGFVARAYIGKSRCQLRGKLVGSLDLSDGRFIWPEGLAHYLDVHAVRLPGWFVSHVLKRSEELEEADVDDELWRRQRSP